jgi:hypothetical protein
MQNTKEFTAALRVVLVKRFRERGWLSEQAVAHRVNSLCWNCAGPALDKYCDYCAPLYTERALVAARLKKALRVRLGRS